MHRLIEWNGYFDYLNTVSAIIQMHVLVGLKFYISHIYIFHLQIFHQNVYFIQSYCALISLRSVWHACFKSVKFSGKSQNRSSCTSDSKMDIFPWLSNIYRWRIYLWNVSYAFRKTARSSKQHVSARAHAAFLSEHLTASRFKLKL